MSQPLDRNPQTPLLYRYRTPPLHRQIPAQRRIGSMAPTSAWEEKRTVLGKLIWKFFWKCLRGSPSLADHYAAVHSGILRQLVLLDFL